MLEFRIAHIVTYLRFSFRNSSRFSVKTRAEIACAVFNTISRALRTWIDLNGTEIDKLFSIFANDNDAKDEERGEEED